ncbi:MAG: integrase arm-type DNA-binding domain-containing protein [Comamonadaceae bacterium]|nr:integrase arm-type DNA-binding domain-containing protein [Comamonadaceae bacterium]
MPFDARRAKALQAGGRIIFDEAPGLRLVATASRKTWQYRYKSPVDGRMRQIAIGHWPTMGYPAALGRWDELRALRDSGVDLSQQRSAQRKAARPPDRAAKKPRGDAYLVADLMDDYLAGHIRINRKPKGAAEVERLLRMYTGSIAQRPATEIRRADAFDLLEKLSARAPVLAQHLRGELGAAWDYALDAGRIPESTPNWWRRIMRGKLRSRGHIVGGQHMGRKLRTLTDPEVCTLLHWLPNFSALIEDIITMYLWTGARGSEIVQMEGAEIAHEPDGWWWTVPVSKLKMGRNESADDLRIPLIGRSLDIVQRRRALYGNSHLFPSRDGKYPHVEQKVVGVALWAVRPERPNASKTLPISRFGAHDLRRTVRTKLSSLGCPEHIAEAVIGHLPSGIVGVYDRHTYDQERREWLGKVTTYWEKILTRNP